MVQTHRTLTWPFSCSLQVPQGARTQVPTPSDLGMPFEEVFVMGGGGERIHTYLVKQEDEAVAAVAPTLVFFHGKVH